MNKKKLNDDIQAYLDGKVLLKTFAKKRNLSYFQARKIIMNFVNEEIEKHREKQKIISQTVLKK